MKRMIVDATSKLSYSWDSMSKARKARCFEEICGYLFEVDSDELIQDVLERLGITEDQLSGEAEMSVDEEAKCFDEICRWLLDYPSAEFPSNILKWARVTKDEAIGLGFDPEVAEGIAASSSIRGGLTLEKALSSLSDYDKVIIRNNDLDIFQGYKKRTENPVYWKLLKPYMDKEVDVIPYEETSIISVKGSTSIQGGPPEGLSFQEWLDWVYYEGFDPSGLSDEEYYELEDEYQAYLQGCSDITCSYIPDITDRYPEGMYVPYDGNEENYDDYESLDTVEDVAKYLYDSVENSGDYLAVIEIWTIGEPYNKHVCDLYRIEDLDKFSGDRVGKWVWYDDTVKIYLAWYDRKHLQGCSVQSSTITADVWDDISQVDQAFTSENTSINKTKVPAVFKLIHLPEGSINLDFGGGRWDSAAEYLEPLGVVNLVYDPYNRSAEHNQQVIQTLREAGGADSATCSNVLNVIKEPEARLNVLKNISKMVKPGGDVYITVYEGTGKGDEGETKSGYQLNRKTADYLEEIQQVFPNASRKGKLIVATN